MGLELKLVYKLKYVMQDEQDGKMRDKFTVIKLQEAQTLVTLSSKITHIHSSVGGCIAKVIFQIGNYIIRYTKTATVDSD